MDKLSENDKKKLITAKPCTILIQIKGVTRHHPYLGGNVLRVGNKNGFYTRDEALKAAKQAKRIIENQLK